MYPGEVFFGGGMLSRKRCIVYACWRCALRHGRYIVRLHSALGCRLPDPVDLKPAREGGGKNTRIKYDKGAWDKLCEEFPWLRERPNRRKKTGGVRLPRATGAKRGRDGTSSEESSAGDSDLADYERIPKHKLLDELPDGISDGVVEELVEHRAGWVWKEDMIFDFGATQLGGRWCKVFKKIPFDGAVGMAQSADARKLCVRYAFPRQTGFAYSKWGEEAANQLAREYCRRRQHFYNCWRVRDDNEFQWENYHIDAYAVGAEFTEFMTQQDVESDVFRMGHSIMQLVPKN
jgi:hypothetical protein